MVASKIQLTGFNNLTKSVRLNIYEFFVVADDAERAAYIEDVDRRYDATRMTDFLRTIAGQIDAEVLSVSAQDYDPHGASALVLMGEKEPGHKSLGVHLTKSHLCAHTYPDWKAPSGVCCLRLDIDMATCGNIVPLRSLDYVFGFFKCDVVVIDYLVRGFTRRNDGARVYLDHEIASISEYLSLSVRAQYRVEDTAMPSQNIWQSKLMRRQLDPTKYVLPGISVTDAVRSEQLETMRHEMTSVFHGHAE